jgi:hypothetical protein
MSSKSRSSSSKRSLKPIVLAESSSSSSSSSSSEDNTSFPKADHFVVSTSSKKEDSSDHSSLPPAEKFTSSSSSSHKEVHSPLMELKVKEKTATYFTPEFSVTPSSQKAYWHLINSEVKTYYIHGKATFNVAVPDHTLKMKAPVSLKDSFVTGQATISTVFDNNPIVSAIKVYDQDEDIVFEFKNMTLFSSPTTFELNFFVQIAF